MKNTYHFRLERLRQEGLKELFEALERGFKKFGVDFYLIGAFARDIWLNMYDLPAKRSTKDIDLAIFISDEAQFNALMEYLIDSKDFSALQDNKFTLFYKEKLQVDLIPFGNIENDDRTVTFPGLTTMSCPELGLHKM
jgi:predicted nucleotidyltransferase